MKTYGKEDVAAAKRIVELNTRNEPGILSTLDQLDAIANDGSFLTDEEKKRILEGNEEIRQLTNQIHEHTNFFQSIVDEVAYDEAQKEITK